jgi:hypothetical protein
LAIASSTKVSETTEASVIDVMTEAAETIEASVIAVMTEAAETTEVSVIAVMTEAAGTTEASVIDVMTEAAGTSARHAASAGVAMRGGVRASIVAATIGLREALVENVRAGERVVEIDAEMKDVVKGLAGSSGVTVPGSTRHVADPIEVKGTIAEAGTTTTRGASNRWSSSEGFWPPGWLRRGSSRRERPSGNCCQQPAAFLSASHAIPNAGRCHSSPSKLRREDLSSPTAVSMNPGGSRWR